MSEVLFVVSARLSAESATAAGPRKDYAVLARTLDADVLDYGAIDRSRIARLLRKLAGVPTAQAWLAFVRHNHYSVIVTDGEHIGIPLALMCKAAGVRTPQVTIGHRLAAAKKRPFLRWLKAHHQITRIALHSYRQYELSQTVLGIPAEQVALVPYQVDTEFWRPQPEIAEERLVSSAGLEFRDYPTLFQAVEGLDIRVEVGAASHWSRRRNTARDFPLAPNVKIGSFDYFGLRNLYARSAIVVVPLADVDFQAGVTTILEAMAMGKPVIVTHSLGQTDVVEDRRSITRGNPPRSRPLSFTRLFAERFGFPVEPTGFYVPPNDDGALQRAISYLMDHPHERAQLGAAGRRTVERLFTVSQFADRMRVLVDEARKSSTTRTTIRNVTGERTESSAGLV